jgi:hypothetical protein
METMGPFLLHSVTESAMRYGSSVQCNTTPQGGATMAPRHGNGSLVW